MQETLQKLISFKTLSLDREENKKALAWIKDQVKNLPVFVQEFESNKFPMLLITTQKTNNPIIWLAAHIDVAEGKDEMFSAKVEDGKIYGRGSFDMKFAIASYLKILKELGDNLSKYNFGLMITSDEELGGANGTKFLLDKGFGSEVAFLPDGGMDWQREKGSKGLWIFKVKSTGKMAHPSMPWLGDNAAENLIEFLGDVKKGFKKEPCGDPLHFHRTININEINTGKTGDIIPDYAEALVDIFFTSDSELGKINKQIEKIRNNFPGIKIETLLETDSFKVPLNNKYEKLFFKIAYERFKIKNGTAFSNGVSDARYFVNKKIPVIETRPKGGDFHGDNEWIDMDDLNKFYAVLKEYIETASIK